jgi:uncharacterized protein YcnI
MKRFLALSLFAAVLPVSASAHVTLEKTTATPGTFYRGVLRVPHGCDGSATVKLRVHIPDGMIAVKPMPKPDWTVSFVKEPYGKTYNFMHGMTISEGVREITWSGKLDDDFYDEFVFTSFLADTLSPGTALYLPAEQDCEKGKENWAEIPAPGQSPHSLKAPAPAIMLVAAQGEPVATFKAGSILIENPWIRATPPGASVAGGYMKIVNSGKETDRLTGGTLSGAAQFELHEMTMTDNVMRMRPLKEGVEIKPGTTVELSPGGLHAMGLQLQRSFKAGDTVQGTLVFEKAGTVSVTYTVKPIGGGETHDHHH